MNIDYTRAIVAGMSRAGTTFLYHQFHKHPAVFVPARKEIGYFSHHFDQDAEWYESFFENAQHELQIDICGVYFTVPESPERIKNYFDSTRIVLMIREPVTWAESFFHQYNHNYSVVPLEYGFFEKSEVLREGRHIQIDFSSVSISDRIRKYQELFGEDLLLVDFSHFQKNQLDVLTVIERFLGISPYFNSENFDNTKINARSRRRLPIIDKVFENGLVINIVLALFPSSWVRNTRTWLDKVRARPVKKVVNVNEPISSSETTRYLQKLFEQDSLHYRSLFFSSPFVLGNHPVDSKLTPIS